MTASQSEELRNLVEQAVGKLRPRWQHNALLLVLVGLISLGGSYFGAYLGERGRGSAIDARFDTVLEQLGKTTKLSEEIKTQVSSEAWVQQSRWTLKRDLYTRLFENLDEFSDAIAAHLFHLEEWRKAKAAGKKENLITMLRKATYTHLDRAERAHLEVRRAESVAEIMLSQEAIAALRDFARRWREAQGQDDPSDGLRQQAEAAQTARRLLIPLANRDLLGTTK